jgi:hypothetical protein
MAADMPNKPHHESAAHFVGFWQTTAAAESNDHHHLGKHSSKCIIMLITRAIGGWCVLPDIPFMSPVLVKPQLARYTIMIMSHVTPVVSVRPVQSLSSSRSLVVQLSVLVATTLGMIPGQLPASMQLDATITYKRSASTCRDTRFIGMHKRALHIGSA